MVVKPIPDGYHTVTPYLVVQGASKLIDFMKAAFGATVRTRMGDDQRIMHAEVQIGDSVIMVADAGPGNEALGSMIHLYVDDADAFYKRAIAAGGSSMREPADQFYGDRSAGLKDAFGNQWWLATHIEDVSPEELAKRSAAMAGPASG